MKTMGKKEIRSEVCFVPAQLYKKVYVCHSYECNCHDSLTEAKPIKSAKVPSAPIQRSLASSSVLAWLFHQKYVLSLPLYRQESEWERYGLIVPRRTLANWVIVSANDWLAPIYELIHHQLLKSEVIHADETPYQILNRSDGKAATAEARIWLFRTTHQAEKPLVLYHSDLTRQGSVAKRILKGFQGFVQCDGYSVYQNIPNVEAVGCFSHVRRKFFDIGGKGKAAEGVAHCDAMFKVERKLKALSPKERYAQRQKHLKPLMERFFNWLDSFYAMKCNLGKAVNYALNQKSYLMSILKDGRLQLSNNLAEQKIKVVVIGRKNHLFSASEKGARANAIAYTLIETAKENGLDAFKYLSYLFEHLPNLDFVRKPELLEDFLPWAKNVQLHCR